MIKQELETLFSLNSEVKSANAITSEVLGRIDYAILQNIDENFAPEVCDVYKKFIQMKDEAPLSMKEHVFSLIRNLAKDCFMNAKYLESLVLYRFLLIKSDMIPQDYSFLADSIVHFDKDTARILIKIYETMENNDVLKWITLGNFYNFGLGDYRNAIINYEKYVELDSQKPVIYSILGNLYSKLYSDESLDKQIEYYERAYELKSDDRYILHGLAFCYEKKGDFNRSDKYYNELLKINPTPTDFYNYGAFLIHNGDFERGHKYFAKRFEIDDINFKYPSDIGKKWDFKSDISNKTILVHYEQGFGDTIMYCRFLPGLKNAAKKVIFVVQDELYSLINNSSVISEDIDIVKQSESDSLEYDVSIALLDLPFALSVNSFGIPFAQGYLNVDENDVEQYASKYINSSKYKIGLSCSGDEDANYNSRNIPSEMFNFLKTDKNEVYSFKRTKDSNSNAIFLGESFTDFYQTACALKNMDLVISADNVILNLAGALGVRTVGLFNKQTNFRWFKIFDNKDVGWYSSVRALQAKTQNDWDSVIEKLKQEID